jgi:hypothetical protein
MLRKLLGTGLLLATLAGCTKLEGTCTKDDECGEGGLCDTSVGICYKEGTEEEVDGGTCAPACAAYEACTKSGCKPRFTELKILSPTPSALLDGGPVQVSAQLVANPLYSSPPYPETLVFSAARNGGGDFGSFGSVTRSGDTYTVPWTLPVAEAQITVTAAHPMPAAVQSAAVNVQVDTVPPAFTITFSNPPARAVGAANQADQRDLTTGYESAFRRDESVTVTVSANEPVSNVTLTVVGIGSEGNPGQAQPAVAVSPGGTCDGAPAFCGTATVDLSLPEMSDVRGGMNFQVEGRDAAGNSGSKAAELKVTRWKWAFDSAGTILGTPAVGNRGAVYIGTSVAGNGKTLAVGPDGAKKWEFTTGDVLGSPAVGEYSSNEENVYVAAKTPTNVPTFYALRGVAGTERQRCTYNGTNDLPSAVAVGMTQGTLGPVETGVTIHNSGQVQIVELRPAGALATECIGISGASVLASVPGGAVVLKGQDVFYGTVDFKATSYDLASGSNSARTGWPRDTNYLARGLALSGSNLYGGASSTDNPAQGSLFSIPTAGATFSHIYPATAASRVFNLAIGSGDIAYFGAETSSTKELLSISLTTPGATPSKVGSVGTLRGAPVVAKNDRLYTFNNQGRLAAWVASTLAPLWYVEVAPGPPTADASPTLDCRRDASGQAVAGLGTVYVPAATKLYAFVVDSSGLDPNAPWPKFQHDARNTGNPDTPITNCP